MNGIIGIVFVILLLLGVGLTMVIFGSHSMKSGLRFYADPHAVSNQGLMLVIPGGLIVITGLAAILAAIFSIRLIKASVDDYYLPYRTVTAEIVPAGMSSHVMGYPGVFVDPYATGVIPPPSSIYEQNDTGISTDPVPKTFQQPNKNKEAGRTKVYRAQVWLEGS